MKVKMEKKDKTSLTELNQENLTNEVCEVAKEKNKSNLLIVLFFGFAIVITIVLFVVCRTTFAASLSACYQEKVANKSKYISFEILSDEDTFSSYKQKVIHNIRVDKAKEVREKQMAERKALTYDSLAKYCSLIKEAYSYEKERKEEKETSKDQQIFEKELSIPLVQEEDINSSKELILAIADSLHYAMAKDAFYKDKSQKKVQELMDSFLDDLSNSTINEEYHIEQIEQGKYDPKPQKGLAGIHRKKIKAVVEKKGDSVFDYVLEYNVSYVGSTSLKVLDISVLSIVGKDTFAILETKVSIPDKYRDILASGVVYPYSENRIYNAQVPFLINEQEMINKSQQFAKNFHKILTFDGKGEELLNSYIELFEKAIAVENNENENEELTKKMNEKTALIETVLDSVDEQYDPASEWGIRVFFEEYGCIIQQLLAKNAQDSVAINHPELFSDEMTEEEKQVLISEIESLKELFRMPQFEYIGEEDLENIDLNAFITNYVKETGMEAPEVIVKKAFIYQLGISGKMNLSVILTSKGVFITHVELNWDNKQDKENGVETDNQDTDNNQDENEQTGFFKNVKENLYETPNLPRMLNEAKNAVSRDMYGSEEAYELEVRRWLYNTYPDYFENPDQSEVGTTGGNFYYSNAFDKFMIDTSRNIRSVYEDLGYIMEGTLLGYLFTPNGAYRNFADDVSDTAGQVADGVKEAISDVGNSISDMWWSLWN